VHSQKIHINTFIGISNYQGDLQAKRFTFSQAGFAAGGGISYELNEKFLLRAGLTAGKVAADDKLNSKNSFRNLNFTSSVTEGHFAAEYYFRNLYEHSLSPYVFAGLAVYHFNPYTKDTSGSKFFLKQLSTEGQGFYQNRKPYDLTQFAIPFGGGVKFALKDNIRVGIELGLRKLFTDYLDDVSTTYVDQNQLLVNRGAKAVELAFRSGELKNGSTYPPDGTQRGGNKVKDWYYFTGLTASFRIGGSDWSGRGNGKRSKSGTGCPTGVY
jgi:opacity protein-like surface antigen